MLNKFLRWLFTGVGGSLLPLFIVYILSGRLGEPNDVIKHGELCIVIAGMCAVALGELFGTKRTRTNADILAGSFTSICLAISTALYSASPFNPQLTPEYIATLSYILFAFSLISCGSCIAISEA